jgi:hypothetical protein
MSQVLSGIGRRPRFPAHGFAARPARDTCPWSQAGRASREASAGGYREASRARTWAACGPDGSSCR